MSSQNIDRFEIEREIDRGAMAVVYLAKDPRLGRSVAIKILPKEFVYSTKTRARFQREAKVIVSLKIPGIVPVYDFGEFEGQPYLVMRYMSGGSLDDKINDGQLSLAESSKILTRLAPVLDEAHLRGLVHRDLKPGNILFDEDDLAYLSDFGVAKMTEGHSETLATQGGMVGTPAYMSPEQVMGKDDLDGRSDIYALGAILFHMLTGNVPFESDTPIGQAMKHIREPVPDIGKIRSDLPPEIQAIIAKAMAKKRDDRYSTASAYAEAVSDLLGNDDAVPIIPVALPKEKIPEALPKKNILAAEPKRKIPMTILLGGLAAILCLLVVGAGSAYFVFSGEEDVEPTVTPTEVSPTVTPTVLIKPTRTLAPPATAAIILPTDEPTATTTTRVSSQGSPGLLPTLRATPTEVTPTATNTRVFIPTIPPTATPLPPPTNPPPPPPTSAPPPPPTSAPPPTNTPQPPPTVGPPTNTPPPIHTQGPNQP
ncbi:MAG TPA: serine/threonine-protein kinase [candidate division Zixibacteria bacterium]|nr:serine/threonine-protein kinase [candidate division Zixibacteria bacterium]